MAVPKKPTLSLDKMFADIDAEKKKKSDLDAKRKTALDEKRAEAKANFDDYTKRIIEPFITKLENHLQGREVTIHKTGNPNDYLMYALNNLPKFSLALSFICKDDKNGFTIEIEPTLGQKGGATKSEYITYRNGSQEEFETAVTTMLLSTGIFQN